MIKGQQQLRVISVLRLQLSALHARTRSCVSRSLASSSSSSGATTVTTTDNNKRYLGNNTPTAGSIDMERQKRELELERANLAAEAKDLTLRLYRTVVRSVRVIRHGNDHDELEFQAREKKRKDNMEAATTSDIRLSMISMLPPVDRVDELRSRAEYYQQYARENFVQESDCLEQDNNVPWKEQHVARYIFHLRRGEEHRQWLLADMKFTDPFAANGTFDHDRVDDFERRAVDYIQRAKHFKMQTMLSPEEFKHYTVHEKHDQSAGDQEEEVNDGWSTDEDDDDDDNSGRSGLPSWLKNPKSA
jgi:hypothetical protein